MLRLYRCYVSTNSILIGFYDPFPFISWMIIISALTVPAHWRVHQAALPAGLGL